jgi:transposase-like protein
VQSPLDDPGWLSSLTETEARCRRYLEELRWPDGVCCPRCEGRSINPIRARRRFYCRGCRHFFSLTSGTIFHNSHLPIWKWFVAIKLILDTDDGLPANELTMLLGGSYKTAWFVEHRIRAAICEATSTSRTTSSIDSEPGFRTYARPFVGPHHQLALKYLAAYQAESNWRRRQRSNPDAFRDTVLALLRAEPLSLDELTARKQAPGPNSTSWGRGTVRAPGGAVAHGKRTTTF